MAAVTMLAQNAAYVTIVFTVFILNLRHIIMSTCIMEKMEKTSLPIRLLLSFGITDEVFAMSMTDKKINKLTPNVIKLRNDEPSRYYCLDGVFI